MNPLSRIAGSAVDRALGLSPEATPYEVRLDVAVPMPDGVTLLGSHYRAAADDEPLPVVLIRSPYGRTGFWAMVFAAPLARRGFQVFMQSTRGTFGSGGQFRPMLSEREDGLATVAWLRDQPWCDGQVSMTGGSYLGHTVWSVAPYVDPPLRSVSMNITAAKITAAFYDHGAPSIQNALNWSGMVGQQERARLPMVVPNPRLMARTKRALRKVPLQAADIDVAGAPVAFWRDFVEHGAPGDQFWAGAAHDGADLTRLPPVSMVTGWWDLFLAQQLRDFAAIRAAGVAARLTVGPWLHGDPGEMKMITQQDVAWLEHHLHGAPLPQGPPVRVFLQKADRWLDFEEWPPPAVATTLYLRAAGGLSPDSEPGDGAPDTFVYDPTAPTPSAGGPLLLPPGKQVDNTAIEARPDVLTYTTEPFPADQDVVGPVSARIFVRPALAHADLFVRVCDVDAKGASRNVVDGIRRLSPDTVPAPDVQVGDDGILGVDVALFPTAYRIQAGHRIRVQISGGSFPRFARSTGTADPFGAATRAEPCHFDIHHDSQHPSCVVLPVLPAAPPR
jgi:putative CocE/NonD family hydrolase